MPAPLVKTKTPGIYKRGGRYAVLYRGADGKQRQESAPTYDAARLLKAKRVADAREGVDNPSGRLSFGSYTLDWIERYPGRGIADSASRPVTAIEPTSSGSDRFFEGQLHRTLVQVTPRTSPGSWGGYATRTRRASAPQLHAAPN